jgi:hypothetical protein
MDLQQAYSKIDELFAEYATTETPYKNAIKSKLLKIICDVVKKRYKANFENGDTDYLPVLTATNSAIKTCMSKGKVKRFSSYLFKCIKNEINKDIEITKGQDFYTLSYYNLKLKKQIHELMHFYNGNKQKVANALEIPVDKVIILLNQRNKFLDREIKTEDSDSVLKDLLVSNFVSVEEKIDFKDNLDKLLKLLDKVWKNIKTIHQEIISAWLTNLILYTLETSKSDAFIENSEEAFEFFSEYSFINKNTVQKFFEDKSFSLSLTYEAIADKYGITKSAVCKKITLFTSELKKIYK